MKAPPGKSAVDAAAAGEFKIDGAVADHETVFGQKLFSLPAVVGADADEGIGVGLGHALVKGGDEVEIIADAGIAKRAQASLIGLVGGNGKRHFAVQLLQKLGNAGEGKLHMRVFMIMLSVGCAGSLYIL